MKRISWISCDSYIDTDLPAVSRLHNSYFIKLLVLISYNTSIDYEKMIKEVLYTEKVEVQFIYMKHRLRSISNIITYLKALHSAKSYKPDYFYISFQGMPYAPFLYRMLLPINKCIAACHNVTTPMGATNEKLALKTTRIWISSFKNINVFSQFQKEALMKISSNKKIMVTPFFLKYYGEPKVTINKFTSEKIRFLVFGNIVKYKRIDLLIDAATILFERGIKNFIIRIAGGCREWKEYQSRIKYPELFDLKIERIPNEVIPDLYGDSHYAVFPYQDIAQSGSITVAFSYNVPTIVSDIEQFREFVVDGHTCLSFRSGSAESLADTMQYAIENHKDIYPQMCRELQAFVDKVYSSEAILRNYIDFFESL